MRSWTGNLPWSAGIYDLCSALVLLQNRQVSISQVSTCKWCVRAQPWASDQVRRTESSSKSHQAITSFRYHFFTMMYILHFSKYKVIPQGISLAISQGFLDPSQTSYLKKKLRQSSEKNESHIVVSGIILPDQELWCQLRDTATVLSNLPARLLSPETPAHFKVSYLCNSELLYNSSPKVGGWGLMGCLGIFKAWNINHLMGGGQGAGWGMSVGKKGDAGTGN